MIKEWLNKNKMRAIELGRLIGVSATYLYWVTRYKKINKPTAEKLFEITGISQEDFEKEYAIYEPKNPRPLHETNKFVAKMFEKGNVIKSQSLFDEQYQSVSKDWSVGDKISCVVLSTIEGRVKKITIQGTIIQKNKYITTVKKTDGRIESFCHADLLCGLAKINK